jgi:hypothetical protein
VNPDGKAEIRTVKVGPVYGRNMIVVVECQKLGEKTVVEEGAFHRLGVYLSNRLGDPDYASDPGAGGDKNTLRCGGYPSHRMNNVSGIAEQSASDDS